MIIAKDLKTGGGGQGSVLNIDPTGNKKRLRQKVILFLGHQVKLEVFFILNLKKLSLHQKNHSNQKI